ncbi:MAG: TetR/AcrR family transcriptional regulator [Sphingomonadales bacterium]
MNLPDLKFQPRTGMYARGQESIEMILREAQSLLINEGYRAISLRKIAAACNMKVGNVTYYFSTKDKLIQEMLDATMQSYIAAFGEISDNAAMTAEEKLTALITLVLDDIETKKTTRLFPELWALANFDPFVADLVESVYEIERTIFRSVLKDLNPALTDEERETLCLFLSASLEGQTMFIGYEKRWTDKRPWIKNLAIKALVDFAKTVTADDIRGL